MAVPIPAVRYATQTWDLDGTEPNFEINFAGGYIRQEDVKAFSVVVDPETGDASDYTVHPVIFLSEADDSATVDISPRPANGRRLVIYRDTPKGAPLVSYEDGAALTKRNLDLQNMQAIFAIAEIVDGLRDAQVNIGETVTQVVETETLVREIYEEVLTLLESAGFVTTAPVVYSFAFDGVQTDFEIESTVEIAGAYDTYVEGNGLKPGVDFTILPGDNANQKVVRFLGAPRADGLTGFAVLRGYSRPFTGTPIETTAPAVVTIVNNTTVRNANNTLFISTSATPITVTIGANTGADDDWKFGEYFSVVALGTGRVTLAAEDGTVLAATEFTGATRSQNSVISATCLSPDNNQWLAGGDLLRSSALAPSEALVVPLSTEAGPISAPAVLFSMRVPYNFTVESFRLSVNSAQSSGNKLRVNIKRNGVSIFSTQITLDNGEATTVTAAVPYVLVPGGDAWVDNDRIDFELTQVGSGDATGLKCYVLGRRS